MKQLSPIKAIRLKCLDCSGGSSNEVKLCPIEDCPLYPFRFGKNPFRKKRTLTEKQKEALKKGQQKFQESKNDPQYGEAS